MTCSQFWGIWGSQLQKAAFLPPEVMQQCMHTACFHTLHVTFIGHMQYVTYEASINKASCMFVNFADATAVPKHLTAISARRKLQ